VHAQVFPAFVTPPSFFQKKVENSLKSFVCEAHSLFFLFH